MNADQAHSSVILPLVGAILLGTIPASFAHTDQAADATALRSIQATADVSAVDERKTAELHLFRPAVDGQVSADALPAASSADNPIELASANEPVDSATSPDASPAFLPGLAIHTDYQEAMQEAVEGGKMMFIYFHPRHPDAAALAFEQMTLGDAAIREKLARFVIVKLPRDAQITVAGKPVTLLEHPGFAEMLGRQGVAVLDFAHPQAPYYGRVVSTFPFTPGKYYRKESLSLILDLPPGTLTQRTMIFAVRIHPERPASTQGQFHEVLAEEAKSHADYQAAILLQGHHRWDSRFQRINAKLPGGAVAQEIVAESWPNENLVEACLDCVDSWRQSPGHWGAVRSRHTMFGYDIQRGRNGIWYATGIFGSLFGQR